MFQSVSPELIVKIKVGLSVCQNITLRRWIGAVNGKGRAVAQKLMPIIFSPQPK